PSLTDHFTFSVCENSTGRECLSLATPLALGPRNCAQSSAQTEAEISQEHVPSSRYPPMVRKPSREHRRFRILASSRRVSSRPGFNRTRGKLVSKASSLLGGTSQSEAMGVVACMKTTFSRTHGRLVFRQRAICLRENVILNSPLAPCGRGAGGEGSTVFTLRR